VIQVSDFILSFFLENKANRYRVLGDHNVDRTKGSTREKKVLKKNRCLKAFYAAIVLGVSNTTFSKYITEELS